MAFRYGPVRPVIDVTSEKGLAAEADTPAGTARKRDRPRASVFPYPRNPPMQGLTGKRARTAGFPVKGNPLSGPGAPADVSCPPEPFPDTKKAPRRVLFLYEIGLTD